MSSQSPPLVVALLCSSQCFWERLRTSFLRSQNERGRVKLTPYREIRVRAFKISALLEYALIFSVLNDSVAWHSALNQSLCSFRPLRIDANKVISLCTSTRISSIPCSVSMNPSRILRAGPKVYFHLKPLYFRLALSRKRSAETKPSSSLEHCSPSVHVSFLENNHRSVRLNPYMMFAGVNALK